MSVKAKPFPANRVERVSREEIDLAAKSGAAGWIEPLGQVVCGLARRLGLGAARVEQVRVQAVRLEKLRIAFPGRWCFAVFANPLAGRSGFLGLDPLLAGRLIARLAPDREVLPGAVGRSDGDHGTLGWALCSALDELATGFEGFEGWRYFGLLESAGQVGRFARSEQLLVGTWLSVQAGWDPGYAVWLEPEESLSRRPARDDRPRHLDPALLEINVAVSRLVGTAELLVGEVQALSRGDVILLNCLDCAADPGQVLLRAGHLVLRGTRKGEQVVIEKIHRTDGGGTMPYTDVHSNLPDAGDDLLAAAELPVTLSAEAGRVDLTVAQLSGLRAGDVLTLPEALLGPIDLRAGGRLVARGELVDVEGRRGVRVTEIGWRRGGEDESAA